MRSGQVWNGADLKTVVNRVVSEIQTKNKKIL